MKEVFGLVHVYAEVGSLTEEEAKERLERLLKEFGEQHGLSVYTQELTIQEE